MRVAFAVSGITTVYTGCLLYTSTAIFGKWHLGSQKEFIPLQNGFDAYYGLPYSNDMWPFHPQQGEVFNFPDLPTYDGNEIIGYNTDQTRLTTDYTLSLIHI